MKKKNLLTLMSLFILALAPKGLAQAVPEYRCGIAIGFPPYQYVNDKAQADGIDTEVAKLVFKTAGTKVTFVPGQWSELMSNLVHNTNKIDLLCGAEITEARASVLDFSVPYYNRHIVLFVLKGSGIKKIDDLFGKLITGDKDSFFERHLGDKRSAIRIMQTSSKEESFKKLKEGIVVGVIAPKEVGLYVARKMNMPIEILEVKDPGSPVAFAVSKGNTKLLELINQSLKKLKKTGQIEEVIKKNIKKI